MQSDTESLAAELVPYEKEKAMNRALAILHAAGINTVVIAASLEEGVMIERAMSINGKAGVERLIIELAIRHISP